MSVPPHTPYSKNDPRSEREKMTAGENYWSNDPELVKGREDAKILCHKFNQLSPDQKKERLEILGKLVNYKGEEPPWIEQSFWCDYGYNIHFGERCYANHNLLILDCAPVTIGDRVMFGPNCSIYTAAHHISDVAYRDADIEFAKPINIGNYAWIGGNVTILPGVTIGNHAVIGAGSVVSRDIPANSVAVGNPCRVIKKIDCHD
eukprot:Blabericola_migrator_1__3752@NODE_2124_length_3236_cov_538_062165_g1346_i0_p3_GENE_NODE_2124_length_3236_cov_538_062165_g1346_i0NODE_2124_length_3236_cov_538_062165_g1346_i0_p3_ORF_typecomplete_len204_score26_88Hexapep_2/PF14602_6/4_9e06Hexapep_2/PF14602_6/8_9e10Mac/PF12464_8/2_2e15Hexapep/PF00132_24/0_022Hexapep/PF00132_24/1_6e09_NODE_2124_length_3236_cov_538_062165_g1346_i023382949